MYMIINKFDNFQYFNDLRYFQMPFTIYGKFARKIMIDKYNHLTNLSTRPQHQRLRRW